MAPFLVLLLEARGEFSPIITLGTWLQWDKSHNIVQAHLWLCYLASSVAHSEPPSTWQLQFKFSYPQDGSWGGFHLWISAQVRRGSLYLSLCLPNLEDSDFSLCPSRSYESIKSCWLFILFSLLFVVRKEWQLLSSLHGRARDWISGTIF